MSAIGPEKTGGRAILYVDDERENLELFRLQFEETFSIRTAENAPAALGILDREPIGVILTDERMPHMRGVDLLARVLECWPDVVRVIVSAYSDADRLLLAMNRGHAHEYVLKPWNADELRGCLERCLALSERLRLLAREAEIGMSLVEEARRQRLPAGIIGAMSGLSRTLELAGRASQSDATVIIQGETGTGKEMVAAYIHERSRRSAEPFVRVNCSALAEGVLESELFGHEQGAFTGALRARKGRFELADGGTLFLDEIGDVSMKLQVSLLRVLQERCFERVGGTRTILSDVRVIAATHRNLADAVKEKRFREDLFYRLNVIPIRVPPLRERREDIAPLVRHFIDKHGVPGRSRRLASNVLEALQAYDWPGNVRELENVVQRALVLSEDEELTVDDFSLSFGTPTTAALPRDEARAREIQELRDAIVRNGGNLARAARMLGIPRTTLVSRVSKLGLV
jgi:DNA-binding NtrC family response regulator